MIGSITKSRTEPGSLLGLSLIRAGLGGVRVPWTIRHILPSRVI